MIGHDEHYRKWATSLVFILVAIATFLRLFLSVELTDESNYVAHAYTFLLDGRLFESDLFIQGTPAIVIAPMTYAFNALFGVEGLVVFLRIVYFLWALAATVAAFLFLRRYYDRNLALVASSFYLAFIPFAIPSWSYNTVPALGAPLSLFLLFSGSVSGAIGAGVVAAIACFCYPPIALMYGALLAWLWSKKKGPLEVRRSGRLVFTLLIAAGGGISAYFILQGWDRMPLVSAFAREFEWVGGVDKLGQIANALRKGAVRSGFAVFLAAGLYLVWRRRPGRWQEWDFWLIALGLVWALWSRSASQKTIGFLIFAPMTLMLFHKIGRLPRASRALPPRWLLSFGLLAALIQGYTSSNILINGGLAMILPLQILLLEAVSSLTESGRASGAKVLAMVSGVAVVLCWGNYSYVYRDDAIWRLNTTVNSGPFRFLRTTAPRAEMLETLHADLTALAQDNKTIFAAYLAPAYFSVPLKPVTGMLFVHESHWRPSAENLILHRTLQGEEWPDVVVTKIVDTANFDYQFENFFNKSGKYSLAVTRPWYRILVRNKSQVSVADATHGRAAE